MIAIPATEDDRARWDAFCAENRASYGAFFHWQDVLRSWGHIPAYILAEDGDGTMRGVLPLCITRGVGARRAFSLPVAAGRYGGPIVTVAEATPALLKAAYEVLAAHGVAWVNLEPDPAHPLVAEVRRALLEHGYACTAGSCDDQLLPHTFRIPLGDFDTVWKKVMGSKVRNHARSAIKKGVVVEEVGIKDFCHLYQQMQREVWYRLGNGCPTLQSLHRALEPAVENVRMYLARVEDNVVGGLYCYYAGTGCFLKGAVSRREYSSYCVNNLTYTRSIRDACEAGLEFYDMGSTPPAGQSGHHRWKSQFGAESFKLLSYKRILRKIPYYTDRGAVRLTDRLSRRLSYGGRLSRVMGPVGRTLVDWRRR